MQVRLHHDAEKYLERLDGPTKRSIKAALVDLAKDPPEGDIIPMAGMPKGNFRLRVGSYRALFREEDNTIFVLHIDPRGQVYKKKNKNKKG
ncbi:plasmid stabilization system protein [Spirochaetia bacterium]|nr:plasmid stabilization system protein [Spirochaetia bacterium]